MIGGGVKFRNVLYGNSMDFSKNHALLHEKICSALHAAKIRRLRTHLEITLEHMVLADANSDQGGSDGGSRWPGSTVQTPTPAAATVCDYQGQSGSKFKEL